MRLRLVCEASNASPMDGRATLATARFRLATAPTRMSASSTIPARAGAVDCWAVVVGGAVVIALLPRAARSARPLAQEPQAGRPRVPRVDDRAAGDQVVEGPPVPLDQDEQEAEAEEHEAEREGDDADDRV